MFPFNWGRRKLKDEKVVVDLDVERILEALKGFVWPKGASHTLQDAVSASHTAYKDWMKKLTYAQVKNTRIAKFQLHLTAIVPVPAVAITEWFWTIHRQVSWRRDFSGDLSRYCWHAASAQWMAQGRGWAEDWCGEPFLWDRLMRAIDEG